MRHETLQQLLCDVAAQVYYYSAEDSRTEVDFIIKLHGEVVPIEVKAEDNVRAKSLALFRDKYNLPEGVRLSMLPYREQERLVNVPLYAAYALPHWVPV